MRPRDVFEAEVNNLFNFFLRLLIKFQGCEPYLRSVKLFFHFDLCIQQRTRMKNTVKAEVFRSNTHCFSYEVKNEGKLIKIVYFAIIFIF